MIDILKGIQTAFNGSGTLLSLFPNGVYLSKAPDNSALPNCVLTVVSVVNDYQTRNHSGVSPYIERSTIQFGVFAETDTFCLTALDDIAAVFDFATFFLVGGDTSINVRRSSGPMILRQDETVWMGFVVYEFQVERTTN